MLIDVYVEALLADPDLADQVWALWHIGAITDQQAAFTWRMVACVERSPRCVMDEKSNETETQTKGGNARPRSQ